MRLRCARADWDARCRPHTGPHWAGFPTTSRPCPGKTRPQSPLALPTSCVCTRRVSRATRGECPTLLAMRLARADAHCWRRGGVKSDRFAGLQRELAPPCAGCFGAPAVCPCRRRGSCTCACRSASPWHGWRSSWLPRATRRTLRDAAAARSDPSKADSRLSGLQGIRKGVTSPARPEPPCPLTHQGRPASLAAQALSPAATLAASS